MLSYSCYNIVSQCEADVLNLGLRPQSFGAQIGALYGHFKGGLIPVAWLARYAKKHFANGLASAGIGSADELVELALECLENFSWFFSRLVKAQDMDDVHMATIATIRFFTKKTFGKTVESVFDWFSSQMELQSFDVDSLRLMISNYDAVKKSPIVSKILKLGALATSSCIAASLGIATKFGEMEDLFTMAIGSLTSELDFLSHLMDTILYIVERLVQCWHTKSLSPFVHSSRSYGRWAAEASLCLERSQLLNNPEANGFTHHGFLSDLERLIEQGANIQKFSSAADEKDLVGGVLTKLRLIRGEVLIRNAAGEERRAPYSLLIAGGSGVGKASFSRVLFAHFAKMYNLPFGAEGIYTRTAASEYWAGFRSHHWGILLDDIAASNPVKCAEDPTITDLLQVINNVAFCPPQAELELKGKTPMKAEFVVGTTNTSHLNAHTWFANAAAVRRRFPFIIRLAVKREFAKDHARDSLDPAKVPPPEHGCYPDLWIITVERVDVSTVTTSQEGDPQQNTVRTQILKTGKITEFIKWMTASVRQFRCQQNNAASVDATLKDIRLCPTCSLPSRMCDCVTSNVEPQTLDVECVTGYPQWETSTVIATGLAVGAAAAASFHLGDFRRMAEDVKERVVTYSKDYLIKRLKDMGSRAFGRIVSSPKARLLVLGLGLATTAYVAYKRFSSEIVAVAQVEEKKEDKFPRLSQTGVQPPSAGDESENFYHQKDDYRAAMLVSDKVRSWKSLEWTKICSKVANGVVHLSFVRRVGDQMVERVGRALCLGGRLYVTDNHIVPDGESTITVTRECHAPGLTTNVTRPFSSNNVVRVPEKELVFFQLLDSFDCTDMTPLLASGGIRANVPGALISRGPDGMVAVSQIPRLVAEKFANIPGIEHRIDTWKYTLSFNTENGLCGSPVVARTPQGPVIVGLHVAGVTGTPTGVALSLTREDVEAVKHSFFPIFSPAPPMLTSSKGDVAVTTLHSKSVFRYIGSGRGRVFGQLSLPRADPKSRVVKTIMHDSAVRRGYRVVAGAPPMRGRKLWRNSLMPTVELVSTFDDSILKKCADSYVSEVLSGLDQQYKDELKHPLDLATAINGIPGRKFVDSVNRSTSAGFPWNTTKKAVHIARPADETWQDPVDVIDEVKERIEQMLERYDSNELCAPLFTAHRKDECLSFKKILAERTRLMNGGPYDWSLVVRMLFLPVVRVIQKNPFLFESMPGVVAQSKQWEQLFQFLTQHGKDRIINGDFAHFDKGMGANLILWAFYCLIEVCKACGTDATTLNRMWGVAYDTACSWCNFDGDLVQFLGSNPSGHPLTVIINCLVNCLYMRYCYHELNPEHEVSTFKRNVALATYGDDNAMGSAKDWFNHTAISEILAKHGVKYTMADKEAESVPFLDIYDASFLKRKWRYEPDLGAHVCPIEENTLHKMMTTCVAGDKGPEEHGTDLIGAVADEYFWYGKEIHARKCEELMEIYAESIPPEYLKPNTFLSWEQQVARWHAASGTTPPESA